MQWPSAVLRVDGCGAMVGHDNLTRRSTKSNVEASRTVSRRVEGTVMALSDNLKGRVAVITGASSGIGAATARQLAARGAAVGLIARRNDKLVAIADEITTHGGTAIAIAADVTDATTIEEAATRVQRELGTTSILFNNAGIMLPAAFELKRTTEWKTQIDLNTGGVVSTIGAFFDQLVEAAADGSPSDLINTSSIAAQNIFPTFAVYAATKAFVTHLSRHLRVELGPKGVRVGVLEPGLIETPLYDHVTPDDVNEWLSDTKEAFQWLRDDDIAEIVTFMVSLPSHVNLQEVAVMPTGQV
ncbi:SDR family oxidoreductase [Rhodococcus sp. NPDC059968]|uniref:SDR family oxidoreductase n=1 Tax=Rhodococcus sp. NPDC059968 TaxID=3347017 RepID=UPI00366D5B7D